MPASRRGAPANRVAPGRFFCFTGDGRRVRALRCSSGAGPPPDAIINWGPVGPSVAPERT